jgi:hypothetical protein
MHTLGVFFSWPDGGVWSNVVADVLWFGAGITAGWPLRHHLGRHLARYAHKHYTELLREIEDRDDSPDAG